MLRIQALLLIGVATALLAGCTSTEVLLAHSVPLKTAQKSIPDPQLLDVGVKVFDPGVPSGKLSADEREKLIKKGTFVQIRRTESRFMAVQLRDTLQKAGFWGDVWVTPEVSNAADVNVTATILHSDGDTVKLQVRAVDATGRLWLDKPYQMETAAGAYNRQRYQDLDAYQDVFNMVANDMAAAQRELSAKQSRDIRTVAKLRYAADMSPEAFSAYVKKDRDGRYEAVRLPAVDDPIYTRTQRVRVRERLFFDTLDEDYDRFTNAARKPYDSWREDSRAESLEIKDLTRQAHWRTGLGIASIIASVVSGSSSKNNTYAGRVASDALMYIGTDMLRAAAARRRDRTMHSESLKELSSSFDQSVQPLIVKVRGTEHRLTGTVDAQFQQWRDLLKQLFMSETGVGPDDLDVYAAPEQVLKPITEPLPQKQAPGTDHAAAKQAAPAEQVAPAARAAAPARQATAAQGATAKETTAVKQPAAAKEATTDAGGGAAGGA
jgi:hypothetical protein